MKDEVTPAVLLVLVEHLNEAKRVDPKQAMKTSSVMDSDNYERVDWKKTAYSFGQEQNKALN